MKIQRLFPVVGIGFVGILLSFAVHADKKEDKKVEMDDETIYLEATLVGDKEQPTVSYFIPWQGTGTPDKLHWNIEQKNDKTLDIIDRDVMVRTMSIYNDLDLENAAPEAP